MNRSEKLYLTMFINFLLLIFGALYLAFTIQMYSSNYIWFMLMLILFLFGFIRGLLPGMIVSIFVVFGYGAYILYKMYVQQSIAEIALNDIVWLFAFPASAIASGFLGREIRQVMNEHQHLASSYERNVVVDEVTGFLNLRSFKQELAEEVSRSGRYHRPMSLLLIEIAYFNELTREYGEEQARSFLGKVAQQIEEVLRDVDKKGYMDEGLFAAILPETSTEVLDIVKSRLTDKFQMIPLMRSKREVSIKVKLRFGTAGCPEHGTEANELYEKARQELSLYVS
ncbi:diguanylate cyclase [Paenibacillus sp. P26]|nr:diguanylate cyclase [Paenibacillus sp. P26]